jgi:hypothetical protein
MTAHASKFGGRNLVQRFLVFGMALLAFSGVAQAQVPCGDHDEAIKHLAEKYNEHPQGIGISAQGAAVELLVSESGTWSVLVTEPGRPTCLVASGESWQTAPVRRPERGL